MKEAEDGIFYDNYEKGQLPTKLLYQVWWGRFAMHSKG